MLSLNGPQSAHLVWPGPEGPGIQSWRLHAGHQRTDIPHEISLNPQQLLGSDLVSLVEHDPDLGRG